MTLKIGGKQLPLELEEALGSEPIRQGDVFAWEQKNRSHPWQMYGLVITADCDLINNKTWGRLSYLPILTFEDYIWLFWRPRAFTQFLKDLHIKCAKRVSNALKKQDSLHAGVSPDGVTAWLRRAGVDGLVAEIPHLEPGHAADLRRILGLLEMSDNVMASKSPRLDLLVKLFAAKMNLTDGISNSFGVEIGKHISSLPGDVFFLSGIVGHEEHGVFAMLRYVSQCGIADIAVNMDDVIYGSASARRVARLRSPYCYALTQNLTRVFSDIGLPKAYEEARKASSVSFAASTIGDMS